MAAMRRVSGVSSLGVRSMDPMSRSFLYLTTLPSTYTVDYILQRDQYGLDM